MSEKVSIEREVVFYTDGACSGNPGPGGYAVYFECRENEEVVYRTLVARFKERTTNNERELSAVLEAITIAGRICNQLHVAPEKVTIVSDSKYCLDSINLGWVNNWHRMGWRKKGSDIPNRQIWEKVFEALENGAKYFKYEWTRGHSNTGSGNDLCDEYARAAIKKKGIILLGNEDF